MLAAGSRTSFILDIQLRPLVKLTTICLWNEGFVWTGKGNAKVRASLQEFSAATCWVIVGSVLKSMSTSCILARDLVSGKLPFLDFSELRTNKLSASLNLSSASSEKKLNCSAEHSDQTCLYCVGICASSSNVQMGCCVFSSFCSELLSRALR